MMRLLDFVMDFGRGADKASGTNALLIEVGVKNLLGRWRV